MLRVPAALHRERFQALTHLPAVEPVCRNAAARRANPANRWLLSTNTDMILLPDSAESLSEVCRELADGFYGLPRFELPEWLWEQLPRSDPRGAMSEVRRLGPLLHLDESSPSHEWVRFDAPGDFQLCLRDDFVAIDGFDERMVLGWHVDSNLSRRLLLHRGSIESLEEAVAGYHCNHNRTPTVYHGPDPVGNDLTRFFLAVERADIPDQREHLGAGRRRRSRRSRWARAARARFTDALAAAIPPAPHGRHPPWNPFEAAFALTYDSAHVLPHVADSIVVSGRHVTIGYLGANPVLRDHDRPISFASSRTTARSRRSTPPTSTRWTSSRSPPTCSSSTSASTRRSSPRPSSTRARGTRTSLCSPEPLRPVVIAFERLVERERARLDRGLHPRRFLLVNSSDRLPGLVRRLEPRLQRHGHALAGAARDGEARPDREVSTSSATCVGPIDSTARASHSRFASARTSSVARLEDFRGFGPGWWLPDPSGIWSHGPRAVLTLAVGRVPAWTRPVLELTFDRVGVRRGRPVRIGLVVDGTRVETRELTGGTRPTRWRVRLPRHALARRAFDVALEFDGDVDWADKNRLGLHLQSLRVRTGLIPMPAPRPARHGRRRARGRIARRGAVR